MFTGIITELGKVKETSKNNEILEVWIEAKLSNTKKKGDSVSIDGACFTITELNDNLFKIEAIQETQNLTNISTYKKDTHVNLENPLKVGDSLDGHFVSGHIDYLGKVLKIDPDKNSKVITVSAPAKYLKHFALKGSVTVNGVSLTISKVNEDSFEVSLIPETLTNTNLGQLELGNPVNIEIDLLSRYLYSLLSQKEQEVTYNFLQERGFI